MSFIRFATYNADGSVADVFEGPADYWTRLTLAVYAVREGFVDSRRPARLEVLPNGSKLFLPSPDRGARWGRWGALFLPSPDKARGDLSR